MEVVRLSTTLGALDLVAPFVGAQATPVVLSCLDADTVIVAAALKDRWGTPVGVWLEVGEDYPASLCARDVATLSWLIELDHVVVSAKDAQAHAEVVAAMLSNDQVDFENEVASIKGAFNRPAPPRPLRVWSYDGKVLRSNDDELRRSNTLTEPAGELTTFS
jgi:hypothetical protein